MRPASVAIVGMSARANSTGHALLRNLIVNGFAGDIHLVGRNPGELDGYPILTDLRDAPRGIDVAMIAVPAAGVAEALGACIETGVATAVVFASGFAELGEAQRVEQARIGEAARAAGLSVIGPNCIGYSNYRDGFTVAFANVYRLERIAPDTIDGVAVVSQSGGLGGHLRFGLQARGVAVSYTISTGNEMDLGLAEFADFLVDDTATRVIALFAEQLHRPEALLQAAARARAAGKAIVLMHSGRGARAQAAAASHTGALAGDYAVMRALVERAGVVVVDSLDELLDVSEVLARTPIPRPGGLGIVTLSGAFCGIALDFADDAGIDVPPLSSASTERLAAMLPGYVTPRNPLDLGTEPIWKPELLRDGVATMLADPAIGGLVLSIPGGPALATPFLTNVIAGAAGSTTPLVVAVHGDEMPLPDAARDAARAAKLVVARSSDRALRAIAAVVAWGNRHIAVPRPPAAPVVLPALRPGTQPEWASKRVLAQLGIATPPGRLAVNVDEALAIAHDVAGPVALKAQAASLTHKTDAGGVMLDVRGADAVRAAWFTLHANVARVAPQVVLDGVLVEAMADRGVELIVGARRDPHWGPIVVVGLGAVFVEVFDDVRIIAADAGPDEIRRELSRLRAAGVLDGVRGQPPVDREAIVRVVVALGDLLRATPQIVEVDINPLVVHAQGAVALDALVVAA